MIPKIIHYCWFGGAKKPKSVKKCIKSWKKYCPDYQIIEWNESNVDLCVNDYAKQAYEEKAWAFVSDYFKVWTVYHYGGIYFDTDVQLIKNLDKLLIHKMFAGFEQDASLDRKEVALGLGFGAEKEHPFIKEHLEFYDTVTIYDEQGKFNKTPIAMYTTELLTNRGLDVNKNKTQDLGDIIVYPTEYFCPKDFITGNVHCTENTFSIHNFDATWYDEKQQKSKKKRWKQNKSNQRREKWRYLPNRILLKILGKEKYQKLKAKRKKK